MKTSVIRIGNSHGIRIPKAVLNECGLTGPVELEVRDGQLVVRRIARPRSGWDEAFRRMAEVGDDELLDRENLGQTEWDQTEWEW